MDTISTPKVLAVLFVDWSSSDYYQRILRKARCLLHECRISDAPQPSFLQRIFKHKNPHASDIKAAYDFVVENYQVGDYVLILDTVYGSLLMEDGSLFVDDRFAQKNRHVAIRQLAIALDIGSLGSKSGVSPANGRIPIKCIFINFAYEGSRNWSGIDRALFEFPTAVENILCSNKCEGEWGGYVLQRGSHSQSIRKEAWHSPATFHSLLSWLIFQTSHIIDYDPNDQVDYRFYSQLLLGTIIQSNCTRRRGGQPCDDAIATGGQLTRITQLGWNDNANIEKKCLVWSSQSYAGGEYSDICSMPLFGPKAV